MTPKCVGASRSPAWRARKEPHMVRYPVTTTIMLVMAALALAVVTLDVLAYTGVI